MGLFSTKKKEQKPENLPPLKFPELPSAAPAEKPGADQPAMKEAAAIRRAVLPRDEPMELPAMPRQSMPPAREMPARQEHPLFIKVDAYREVVDTLSMIKAKLSDANHILDELTKLKEEEDRELTEWHSDLSAIKEKLMLVDQKLFEQ